MPVYAYHTLQGPSEGIYKEKGSKFLSFAYPVNSEIEIKERIEHLKKEYFDAKHHCYAWMLGAEKNHFRTFDDGEPNHSAGDPILGQIRSKGITNVLIVVVRYFGGIKLGVGGLIGAYKSAVEDALSKAIITEKEIVEVIELSFDYLITSDVMRLIKEFDLKIIEQEFQEMNRMKVSIPLKKRENVLEKLTLMKAMGKMISLEIRSVKDHNL
jgi:uncharacterized YigZ family protein